MEEGGIKETGVKVTEEGKEGWRVKTRNTFPVNNMGRILSEELFHYAVDEYFAHIADKRPVIARLWTHLGKGKVHLGTGHEEPEGE